MAHVTNRLDHHRRRRPFPAALDSSPSPTTPSCPGTPITAGMRFLFRRRWPCSRMGESGSGPRWGSVSVGRRRYGDGKKQHSPPYARDTDRPTQPTSHHTARLDSLFSPRPPKGATKEGRTLNPGRAAATPWMYRGDRRLMSRFTSVHRRRVFRRRVSRCAVSVMAAKVRPGSRFT